MPVGYSNHRWLGILLAFSFHSTNVLSFHTNNAFSRGPTIRLHASSSGSDDDGKTELAAVNDDESTISTVTIDDGGSDLTDRFKYKVHALMGTYDPVPGAVDDENQAGNIIGALLEFPTEYTFTVVGKTVEDSAGDAYVNEVKSALSSILGSDAKTEMRVVPRGKKFTRVSAKVTVESASIISSIYEELGALEATVMKF
mmetsp:Transcript_10728/g.23768  ORF Transcript_10728/g.23768 Transcript_10728/m.23768 type:complete len:199 (+) Transcript_10728:177-773(+)|eukprot:CAMPEP_0172326656 /NCGR_PEP_ID=MMETSP1058-20130122/57194_1 /TAXON_ID=83371 /ORGANISM="Detonula confervacea, Strain CCMP 353" /LENGTH=198 /DNA_ID=CAMNT_0013043493 /DNA_START=137 /DNA_END=733 /DNA_ORIENTATION=+